MPPDESQIEQAAEWLRDARRMVVFTGAGVSAESGIPTFRDDSGLWQRFPSEQFATLTGLKRAFWRQPRRFAQFMVEFVGPIARAEPNIAHRAIVAFERHVETVVVTQNIDGLHQRAGSTKVREIHGALPELCTANDEIVRLVPHGDMLRLVKRLRGAATGLFPRLRTMRAMRALVGLSRRGFYRPRVVLFGESLAEPDWRLARNAVEDCDVLLIVGTSQLVLPAAMLPQIARERGAKIIVIDPEAPGDADAWIAGNATEAVPRLLRAAFGEHELLE